MGVSCANHGRMRFPPWEMTCSMILCQMPGSTIANACSLPTHLQVANTLCPGSVHAGAPLSERFGQVRISRTIWRSPTGVRFGSPPAVERARKARQIHEGNLAASRSAVKAQFLKGQPRPRLRRLCVRLHKNKAGRPPSWGPPAFIASEDGSIIPCSCTYRRRRRINNIDPRARRLIVAGSGMQMVSISIRSM